MNKLMREEVRAEVVVVGELLDVLEKAENDYRAMAEDPLLNAIHYRGHADGLEHAGQLIRTLAGGI